MKRIQKLQKQLARQKFSSILISKPQNIRYLCGFTGSNGQLFVTAKKATLVTDFRYFGTVKKQLVKGVGVFDQKEGIDKLIKSKTVGFEESHLTVAKLRAYKKVLKGKKLVPSGYIVERMRMIKDQSEIKIMKQGVKIMEESLKKFIKTIKIGQSEDEMEWNLFSIARKLGADEFSFPPIITFGKNTADVHHQKDSHKLKKGEEVLLDFGIEYKGYMTDMTRVFYFNTNKKTKLKTRNSKLETSLLIGKGKGKGKDSEHKIYSIVLEANQAAIKAIKVGVKFSKIDKTARSIIDKAGFGEHFGHAVGHGIGLKVHEHPSVSEKSKDIVKPGMVFTIEPGIYIQGKGGVRIEDMIYVNGKGKVEVLTRFGK